MDFETIIRTAAADSDKSLKDISRGLGRSDNYINNYFSGKRIPTIYNMARMLDVCGYDLVAIPKGTRPPNALKVDAVE